MRDQLDEPFEFRVHTRGGSASSRRPRDSVRVGALVLALGVATLCAVCWPSHPQKARDAADVQTLASTNESAEEEFVSGDDYAPRGGFEDAILNDRRSELDDVSALELADASLIDEEETDEPLDADVPTVAKNRVASTSYEERREGAQIASSSFETRVEPASDDEFVAEEQTQVESTTEEEGGSGSCRTQNDNADGKASASTAATTPGYFARAANLPGKHNSFSKRNFARATNLIDPNDAYSPRSLTNAAQVDELDVEARQASRPTSNADKRR